MHEGDADAVIGQTILAECAHLGYFTPCDAFYLSAVDGVDDREAFIIKLRAL